MRADAIAAIPALISLNNIIYAVYVICNICPVWQSNNIIYAIYNVMYTIYEPSTIE